MESVSFFRQPLPAAHVTSPLESPLVRHGIGLSGAATVIVVGVLFFEPPVQYMLFGIAVLDAVVTPKILERAVEGEDTAA